MNMLANFLAAMFAMKVGHLNFKLSRFCVVVGISLLMVQLACAQGKPKPALSAPAPACTIAEFRYIALTHHDPLERQNKIIDWLLRNGSACTPTQMSILISSKAALLGTSDSVMLGAVIDSIMEKKMGGDQASLSRYYRPDVQVPPKGREEAPAANTIESGPGPKAGTGVPPAVEGAVQNVVAVAGMPGAMQGAPGAVVAPNISINMGGPKPPEEDMSRKYPLPSEPMFVFPPEFGNPLLNYFGNVRRQFVRSFFMETLSPGKCPEGMNWRNDACEVGVKAVWRFGEKLPQGTKTYPVDARLIAKLNFDPGYTLSLIHI
jgi:hypothetical protein